MEEQALSLETLAQGAAVEKFNDEMQRVLNNIIDPNTSATKERTVTLKVKIKPDERRGFGVVTIETSSVVAPVKGTSTQIFIEKQAGQAVAVEHNPQQPELPMNVRAINER